MQTFGRLKVIAAVSLIVGGTYAYADYMRSVDDNERRTYFPAADVSHIQFDEGDDAGDVADAVQAAAPDASGEFAEDGGAVQ